ncbi:hypothetical protein GCM10022261_03650 [Brevibacterium daeguense]|uniref:Uncharacterized protein n=1 Tax=Brevibacterium daeguense TaxID=909936 RepID=A0ABP8EFT5_9MICO|nr:hypothetical protein [Brevibacterium daeguense]
MDKMHALRRRLWTESVEEAPVLARMHHEYPDQGLRMTGKHHEICPSDPRKAAPDRLRTILRQPMRPIASSR